jgi:UDP-N-acetyl-D-galactosamine dehydrogenase
MGRWVADCLHQRRGGAPGSVLVMGLTFKEDVPDLRNSRVVDVVRRLRELGHEVTVHDPHADPAAAVHELQMEIDHSALSRSFDLVVAAVPHAQYRAMGAEQIASLVRQGGCVADLKGMWRHLELGGGVDRWTL